MVRFGVLILLLGGGCARVQSLSTPTPSSSAGVQILENTCAGSQVQFRLNEDPEQTSFQESLEDFISATFDPKNLGTVSGEASGSTGVTVKTNLAMDADAKIISARSQFKIIIKDSLVGTPAADGHLITEIQIAHDASSQLSGGYLADERQLHLEFVDPYGKIILDGTLKDGALEGTLKFDNLLAFDGGTPRSGTLGHFRATSCRF